MMRLMGSPDLVHVANSPRLAGSIDEVSRRIKDIGAASLPARPHSAVPQTSLRAPGSEERTPRKSGGDIWTYNSARVTSSELAGVPGPPQPPCEQLGTTPQPPHHGPSPLSAQQSRPSAAPDANQRDAAMQETPKQVLWTPVPPRTSRPHIQINSTYNRGRDQPIASSPRRSMQSIKSPVSPCNLDGSLQGWSLDLEIPSTGDITDTQMANTGFHAVRTSSMRSPYSNRPRTTRF